MNINDFKKALHAIVKMRFPDATQVIIQVYSDIRKEYADCTATVVDNGIINFFDVESNSIDGCISLMNEAIRKNEHKKLN